MASTAKEFHRLMKKIDTLTDGQASILDIDWEKGNLHSFYVIIRPNSGLYKHGKFKFQITLLKDYPLIPPAVYCHTDIYHPNIDPTAGWYDDRATNVCINLFEQPYWSRSYGLEGTVLSLLFLMHNPNIQDPVSPYFEGYEDEELLEENVRKYMAGELCEDTLFDTNFCVKDGVLIEDSKSVASKETEIEGTSFSGKEGEPRLEKCILLTKSENAEPSADVEHQGANDIFRIIRNNEDVEMNSECANHQDSIDSFPSFRTEERSVPACSNDGSPNKTDTDVKHMTFETELCGKIKRDIPSTEAKCTNHSRNINTDTLEDNGTDGECGSLDRSAKMLDEHSSNYDSHEKSNFCLKNDIMNAEKNVDNASKLDFNEGKVTRQLSAKTDEEDVENVDNDQSEGDIELVNIDGECFLLVHRSVNTFDQDSSTSEAIVNRHASFHLVSNNGILESFFRTLGITYMYTLMRHYYERVAIRFERLSMFVRHYFYRCER